MPPSPNRATFPPQHTESRWTQAIRRLAHRLNPPRRLRTNPRVVKRKYVSWHVKRVRHALWPQPDGPPLITILPDLDGIAARARQASGHPTAGKLTGR